MEVNENIKRSSYKKQSYIDLIVLIIIIFLLNYISSFFYVRIDLTSEKRYTLTNKTKEVLKNLKEDLFIKIFLDGDLPYNLKILQKSIKETLDEFRSIAGDKIQYEFIDIASRYKTKKEINNIYKQLYEKGIIPYNIEEKSPEGKITHRVVFPGALINSGDKETAVNFIKTSMTKTPEEVINSSIEDIEYNITNAIRKLQNEFGQYIAFIEGHGELQEDYVKDLTNALTEYFNVERVRLNNKIYSLTTRKIDSITGKVTVYNKYDLIIIADPDSVFDEKDKYIIDQYLMYGGKILFVLDGTTADIDSLAYQNSFICNVKDLNLSDQLFKYGIRVNYNLIQDIQCALIPVNIAPAGSTPQFSPYPWIYFPLLIPNSSHPVGKNVNIVKSQFPSTVDAVGENPEVKKFVLLTSSEYSRIINAPAKISLSQIRYPRKPEYFPKSFLPVCILLEGTFESVYKNRLAPEMYEYKEIAFKEKSVPTMIAVISDGDIIKNNVKRLGFNTTPLPLGYDRYTGETFGNKDFVLNLIKYMLDSKNFTELNSKYYQLRLLNKSYIENNSLFIKIINTLLPVIIVIIAGIIINFVRKINCAKI
ncbi:MAG: gliding motility-associated ABC transporter substrate-binding protein GldG [Bacteroidales bacterium]|nr:gliding motility-associated ABC transporter substrate-binding protein GldG [Bacteroidales bacterium]